MPDVVTEVRRTLGSNIRTARKAKRVTMDRLARRVFVSSPTIRKLERGDPTVSVGNLAMVLWALDISLSEVSLRWNGEMIPPSSLSVSELLPPHIPDDNF